MKRFIIGAVLFTAMYGIGGLVGLDALSMFVGSISGIIILSIQNVVAPAE